MLRSLPFLLLLALAACGGSPASEPEGPRADGVSVSLAPSGVPGSDESSPDASGSPLRTLNPWVLSTTGRPLDGLRDTVAYRYPDEVTGVSVDDVVLYARCLGDRTQVELDWGVLLGDDVYEDEIGTKRVLVRFSPEPSGPAVWDVSNTGAALVVPAPDDFLRRFVASLEVLIQTTSWNGTVMFAQFIVAPDAVERLNPMAQACGWILDPEEAAAAARRDAATLYAAERQRVLETYVGTPLRDDLDFFAVREGETFVDLPSPVHRAYLGFGVAVSDVEAARDLGRGLICLSGQWVVDEITLRDCYLEDSLDPEIVEGIAGVPVPPPPSAR